MFFKLKIIFVILIFFLVSLLSSIPINSQNLASNSIKKRKKQLEKLTKSIKNTRYKIKKLSKKEKSTLSQLQLNQQNRLAINKFIIVVSEQLKDLQKEIQQHDSAYYQLSMKLRHIIIDYARISRKIYLDRNESNLKLWHYQ